MAEGSAAAAGATPLAPAAPLTAVAELRDSITAIARHEPVEVHLPLALNVIARRLDALELELAGGDYDELEARQIGGTP